MSLEQRINKHKGNLAQLSPDSPHYFQLKAYIAELETALTPKKQVTLHVAEEAICESCQ